MSTGTQVEVVMPQMGVSVSEGTVTRWLKQPGDHVALDEPLLEISTDKVDTEVPSPASGVVTKIVAPEGETVDVGALLATIEVGGEGAAAPAAPAPAAEAPQQLQEEIPAAPPQAAPARRRTLKRYRKRWKIERTFAWLGNYRRLVVRHENHLLMYQAFFHVACLLITMRYL